MGCLFGAHLAPVANVVIIGHWAQQLAALQQGLVLESAGGVRQVGLVDATSDISLIAPCDIALVLVKSYQTEQAAHDVSRVLKRDGLAITLQNGIGNDLKLASTIGSERVLSGTTTEGATLVRPGVVRHAGRGSIKLPSAAGPRTALLDRFVALLRQVGFSVSLTPDVKADVWQKVAINAAINPLTALVGAPNGFLLASEAAKRIAQGTAREAALVARARGCELEPGATAQQAMEVARATRHNLSSMLQDLNNQRPTELEAITGAVMRLGKDENVPTPYNDALYKLLTRKLRGEFWPAGIKSLASELQPLFRRLYEEGQNAEV